MTDKQVITPARNDGDSDAGGSTDNQRATQPGSATDDPSARRGRVHWDTAAPIRKRQGGTTVTIRSPPTAAVPSIASPSGVQRSNHPGALNLTDRLGTGSLGAVASKVQAQSEQQASAQGDSQPPSGDTAPHRAMALSLAGSKSLDEQGLDNRAFLELQRELQRHESTASDVIINGRHTAEQDDAVEALELHDRATALDARLARKTRRVVRPDTPDRSSGATTPGTDTTSDSGSYDAANDSDLDHIDFFAGETDGMPSRPRRHERERMAEEAANQPKGWARLRSILVKSPNEKSEEDAVEAQTNEKAYEEGGPTNLKSVPVTTSSGTRPAGPRSKPTKYEREAARLVRAHRLMTGHSVDDDSFGGGSGGPSGGMSGLRRDHLESGASTPDALDTAANMSAKPVTSGGVLGNLLRLYEQQQREERQARLQTTGGGGGGGKGDVSVDGTSPLSSPALDITERSFSDVVRSELGKRGPGESDRQRHSLSGEGGAASPEKRRRSLLSSGASPGPGAGAWTASVAGGIAGASKKAVAIAAKEAGLDTLEDAVDERPKASRSGAGVFGALVATTGNLIGAVSPHHAQIGPNPKRPGYTLDRYLLPEMNAKTLRRTAEIVADAAPRVNYRSQPPTPGHHSPSQIMRKETNDSNETQAASPHSGAQTPKKAGTRPSSLLNSRGAIHSRKGSGQNTTGSHHMHLPHMPNFGRGWTTGYSAVNTPDALTGAGDRSDYFGSDYDERLAKQEWQRKLRKRAKDKRKKEEIFITMHVAAILQRQEFLLKLSRALMMFGAPTHRIETQIQQTARVLDINCRCIYLPNLMLFAFGDDATHTSETKFIKQAGGLDLTKLTDMHSIYWNVIHDKIGVDEASRQLDELMRRKPLIGRVPMVLIGGFCSAFICVGSQGFGGSFVDALIAFPLGMFLVFSQLAITTELFSNVFEILFAAINSFAAAGLASTDKFCYGSVVSGSIVLILPGFLVLSGALELQSKNLIAGSVRLVYAIIYSLFLGFGISIGSSFWLLFSGGTSDNTNTATACNIVHQSLPWWGQDPSPFWAFLTVPGYATALSLRNQAKASRKEFPVMVLIAIAGWAVNHFASGSPALKSRSDVTSALGAFTVGLLSNIFGRMYDGKSYTVAAVGVLYQLPSGLSAGPSGSLLSFANTNSSSSDAFNSGFQVAAGLVEVALGLTVGLYAATVLAYIVGGRKVRGGGLFSF